MVKILRKEMNILFSCDEYPPLRTGGIGTATKTVAEGLVKKGHKVFVVSGWPYNHDLPYLSEVNGVTVFRIKYFNNLRKVLSKNTLMCKLIRTSLFRLNVISKIAKYEWHKLNQFIAQLVEEKNIDIIELPDYNVLTQFVINKARLYHPTWNIPVVGRVHGNESFLSYYRNGKLNSLVKENDYDFFMSCFKILSVSRFAANFVHDVLNVGKKIDVIHNPMSNKFIVNPTEINNDRKNEIIFIGKLIKEKGAFNLIKAFNIFSENHPEYHLIMIGAGDIEAAKTFATKEALSHIEFTGFIAGEQIRSLLDRAAFAVVPSFFETLGQAAIEIMSRGNILIYTNTATGTEIIEDGKNGFLVNPYDVDDILKKMDYVAEHINLLSDMRRKAVENVYNKFAEPLIVSQLEQYYKNVINEYDKQN